MAALCTRSPGVKRALDDDDMLIDNVYKRHRNHDNSFVHHQVDDSSGFNMAPTSEWFEEKHHRREDENVDPVRRNVETFVFDYNEPPQGKKGKMHQTTEDTNFISRTPSSSSSLLRSEMYSNQIMCPNEEGITSKEEISKTSIYALEYMYKASIDNLRDQLSKQHKESDVLRVKLENTLEENKILKKAVTIQVNDFTLLIMDFILSLLLLLLLLIVTCTRRSLVCVI